MVFPTILNLLTLCRRFEITKAIKNLEEAVDHFVKDFKTFKDTQGFLNMSRENLKTILSCDGIPLDEIEIFECACRWAEHQCKQKKIEATGENCREVLDTCFFEIRFPTMTFDTFITIFVSQCRLFTVEESRAITEFIGLNHNQKAKYDRTQIPFKSISRSPGNSFGCSVLRLPTQFKATANPPFACDGSLRKNVFKVNKNILLRGIGFLGPINGDTQYDVTVQIRANDGSFECDSGAVTKKVLARKGEVFYFLFKHPILFAPNSYASSWKNCEIQYSLKGANSVSQYKADNPKDVSVQMSGVEFNLSSSWSGQPVAELLYKKLD